MRLSGTPTFGDDGERIESNREVKAPNDIRVAHIQKRLRRFVFANDFEMRLFQSNSFCFDYLSRIGITNVDLRVLR